VLDGNCKVGGPMPGGPGGKGKKVQQPLDMVGHGLVD